MSYLTGKDMVGGYGGADILKGCTHRGQSR